MRALGAILLKTSVAILLLTNNVGYTQKLNSNWEPELSTSLTEFLNCTSSSTINTDCRVFAGQSLKTVYGLDDFYSNQLNRFMYVNEISDLVINNDKWTLLGKGFDQKALTEAQDFANSKKAVIAVYRNAQNEGMHVALILPGTAISSGTWGYKVPNSSSFFTGDPSKSFINKGLSYAFTKSQIGFVNLYVRKY